MLFAAICIVRTYVFCSFFFKVYNFVGLFKRFFFPMCCAVVGRKVFNELSNKL